MVGERAGGRPGNELYARLEELLAEATALAAVVELVRWDEQTYMPPEGGEARGWHLAVLGKVAHEHFVDPEIGRLLEALRPYEESLPYDSDEASLIRVTRRRYEKMTKLPVDLVLRMAEARSEANRAWLAARKAKDYKVFRPALEKTVSLSREAADALGWKEHPLDALLDQAEPGMTASALERLFGELRETLVPLAKAIFAKGNVVDDSCLHQRFDPETQLAASREAVRAIGFDIDRKGRMDLSVHPFTTGFASSDVRITTRVKDDFLNACFFASLHEAGHGTYGQGLPPKFERGPLGDGSSSGIHESQSRLWENMVGRSRPFLHFFYPRLQALFPAQLGRVPLETFYRAINKVEPSLIRVEADEVTYNLHIMVRFELEKAVLEGSLKAADLAEAWNAKFKDYLGLVPPDDLVGVLQDIHWTFGFGGGFAGYTIGNVAAAQFYQKALEEMPDLPDRLARGDFAALLGWMNRNVHAYGAKFEPQELLERVTGQPLTARPYLDYVKAKYTDIYGL